MTFSVEWTICCSIHLSLIAAAAYQMLLKEVKMDSMMTVQNCTIIVFGQLSFFSFCMRSILCWALVMRELMFSSHLTSWVMMEPKNQKNSTMSTGVSCRVMDEGGTWSFLNHLCCLQCLDHQAVVRFSICH